MIIKSRIRMCRKTISDQPGLGKYLASFLMMAGKISFASSRKGCSRLWWRFRATELRNRARQMAACGPLACSELIANDLERGGLIKFYIANPMRPVKRRLTTISSRPSSLAGPSRVAPSGLFRAPEVSFGLANAGCCYLLPVNHGTTL